MYRLSFDTIFGIYACWLIHTAEASKELLQISPEEESLIQKAGTTFNRL